MNAFCGLDCKSCGAYIAFHENDDKLRKETAEKWSVTFKTAISPDKINCEGCKSNSDTLFEHCRVCEVRLCASKKGVDNCTECSDYPCEQINYILTMTGETQMFLDSVER
ncbi:MAG: DUF3795 domain-containing protein [Spirochaetes bacterium]|nr:DUF3795 domain-containing protein [Spirochaetota bacterium]